MPQTEEEHLENQYLDYEEKEKSITDAEVSHSIFIFRTYSISFPIVTYFLFTSEEFFFIGTKLQKNIFMNETFIILSLFLPLT
jgi:hypothetical protein